MLGKLKELATSLMHQLYAEAIVNVLPLLFTEVQLVVSLLTLLTLFEDAQALEELMVELLIVFDCGCVSSQLGLQFIVVARYIVIQLWI